MLKLKPRPTAVAVFGDVFALGAMRAFQEAGLKIPDDLVLTGFDNTLSLTEYTCPPLTTVQQNTTGMGRSSIRLLLDSIEGKIHVPDEGQATFFKPRLIVRESSGDSKHLRKQENE
jgi:DNA-binding LacI/PurR family transcriptional regulator